MLRKNIYKGVEFRVSIFLPVLFLVFFYIGLASEYLIMFACICIHELAHVIAAMNANRKISAISILPVGLNAQIEENQETTYENILIYLWGPLVNFLLCLAAMAVNSVYPVRHVYLQLFYSINLSLGFFNLLPIVPLDGGKILMEILKAHFGLFHANKYLKRISKVLLVLAMIIGLFQFMSNNRNFSLILLAAYFIFTEGNQELEVALMNIKHIVYRRARLLKRGVYPARDIVVVKSMRLGEVLKCLDFDRFHFIYVLDNDLRLIKIYSEQELLDGMLRYNTEITFEEFVTLETNQYK